MSIQMHVLFSGKLPSKTALARTMRELGFPLTIAADVGSLETHHGYIPMRLRREEAGVEFDTFNDPADVEEIAGENFDPRFERSASFRWGGDEMEMLTGMCSAAALAKLVDGMVLDGESGELATADEAVAFARHVLERHLAKAEPSGTRPQDLKRYLKPLLELRSDLVLVGRMLLVRPVRHLLRGAYFDRSSNKYSLYLYRYVDPLYYHKGPYGIGDRLHNAAWHVWQPHFQSLLIDCLSVDVFPELGEVITLDDFVALPYRTGPFLDTQMISLFLIGGRDHAEEYVRQIERNDRITENWKKAFRRELNRVTEDIATICAQAHAREAETVRKLKLEHIWEPSPFPVELPAGERTKAAEPLFTVDPWIPRPESLLVEAPDAPGEIRYAKRWLYRETDPILVASLTPEAAEERHRAHEQYTLLARLPDGCVFFAIRNDEDRNNPSRGGLYESLLIALQTPLRYATGQFFGPEDGIFELSSIKVYERSPAAQVWSCRLDLKDDDKIIWLRRGEGERTALTPSERALAMWGRLPEFGEYTELIDRLRSLLRTLGYGELL